MLSTYNDPSHVLTGRSTHNERIERLWRDVTRCVSSSFIDTFTALEAEQMLDPTNEVDIFCLHFVFLPRVNKALADFKGSWNSHPLSTEGNKSPLQLFVEGLSASGQYTESPQQSNLDLSVPGPTPEEAEVEAVQVPSNKFVPCSQLLTDLQTVVNPISHCTDFGKGFFYRTVQLTGQHMPCTHCQLE